MPMPKQALWPPSHLPLLTCPNCSQPMRILVAEYAEDRETITLVCDQCKTEAIKVNPV